MRRVILSADEFVRLRRSRLKSDYNRAAYDCAANEVWHDVIARFPEMKIWVVHNKTVPGEILEMLSVDEDAEVRIAVAMKRRTPPEVLLRLAGDSEFGVRMAVACNRKAPLSALRSLSMDSDERVATEAGRRMAERFGKAV